MNTNKILLEGCIDSIEDADHYHKVKINRFELCSHLEQGGLSPELGLVDYCLNKLKIPGAIMLRLRNDFTFVPADLKVYAQQIMQYQALGGNTFIFGFLKAGHIDIEACKKMIALLDPKATYAFHMAIDQTTDYHQSLETLIDLGFKWVLTKGGNAQPAMENLQSLKQVVAQYQNRIHILVGGKVTNENWQAIADATNANWFHGRKIK